MYEQQAQVRASTALAWPPTTRAPLLVASLEMPRDARTARIYNFIGFYSRLKKKKELLAVASTRLRKGIKVLVE